MLTTIIAILQLLDIVAMISHHICIFPVNMVNEHNFLVHTPQITTEPYFKSLIPALRTPTEKGKFISIVKLRRLNELLISNHVNFIQTHINKNIQSNSIYNCGLLYSLLYILLISCTRIQST